MKKTIDNITPTLIQNAIQEGKYLSLINDIDNVLERIIPKKVNTDLTIFGDNINDANTIEDLVLLAITAKKAILAYIEETKLISKKVGFVIKYEGPPLEEIMVAIESKIAGIVSEERIENLKKLKDFCKDNLGKEEQERREKEDKMKEMLQVVEKLGLNL